MKIHTDTSTMNYFKKNMLCHILIVCFTFIQMSGLFAQELESDAILPISNLIIEPTDIRLEVAEDGGWNLYIRKKEGIESVILSETTKDPLGQSDSYTYRASEWNAINGDERRLLDGEFLDSEYARYSIMDSTPQRDSQFGSAFQLYIPPILIYGYPWSRSGEVIVEMGTFINIRSFEKPYADYTGSYADNPFMFDFLPAPEPEPEPEPVAVALTDSYNSRAVEAFNEIATGMMIYSRGPETLTDDVMKSFKELPTDKPIDVVFAVDATGSMWDDIKHLQEELIPALSEELKTKTEVRLGLLFYRDFTDSLKYKNLPVQLHPFTNDPNQFFKHLDSMNIKENSVIGGDTPEAVYEALYASLEYYQWNPDAERKIILIGDAEPHSKPRGVYGVSKDKVENLASAKNITIDAIITPDGRSGTR